MKKRKAAVVYRDFLALAGAWLGLFTSVGEQSAATKDFLQHLTVFVLACFVGWQWFGSLCYAAYAFDECDQRHFWGLLWWGACFRLQAL